MIRCKNNIFDIILTKHDAHCVNDKNVAECFSPLHRLSNQRAKKNYRSKLAHYR